MRIADKMQFNQVYTNVSKNRSDMADLQNQAATQKRVTKPSDDPLASTRVMNSRTEERGNTQFTKNINQLKNFLEFTDQSLSELSEALIRAKELAISQSSDAGASEQTRRITAVELEQIHNQAIQIGNRKLGDRYVFSGFKTQTMPFNVNGDYFGDSGDMKIQTHKDSFTAMNIPGSKVFLGKGVDPDGIARATNLSPTTVDELRDMRAEDKRVEQDQQEREENYILTRGPASYGSSNGMGRKDPTDGAEGVNVFKVLKGLETAMRVNDKVGVQDSLELLDQAISQVVQARSEVGSRVMSVNATMDSIQKAIVDNKTLASQLEDADVLQVVSDINKTDSTLRATLETSGKLLQPTLLDFLK